MDCSPGHSVKIYTHQDDSGNLKIGPECIQKLTSHLSAQLSVKLKVGESKQARGTKCESALLRRTERAPQGGRSEGRHTITILWNPGRDEIYIFAQCRRLAGKERNR